MSADARRIWRLALPIIYLALAATFPGPAAADQSDTVFWAKHGFAGVYVLSGPNAGQGIGDKIVDHVIRALPDYRQTSIDVGTLLRMSELVRGGLTVCTAAMHSTAAREREMVFSTVGSLAASVRLVVAKSSVAKLPGGPKSESGSGDVGIELDDLVRVQGLRGAVALGRVYGGVVDRFVGSRTERELERVVPNSQAIVMLLRGRVDYTFGFPSEVDAAARAPGRTVGYELLRIADQPAYTEGRFACARTPTGYRLIEAINQLLAAEFPPFPMRYLLDGVQPATREDYERDALPLLRRLRMAEN